MELTATDLFAGAGGSSTGATQAGVQIRIAANHWRLAVDVHNENHPDTDHDCADISQVDPRRYPRTDLLLASPECTWHSPAAGRRRISDHEPLPIDEKPLPAEAGERSRATMWDVPRFAEYHRYRAVVVENVAEASKWPPFRAWLMAMDSIGYQHEIVCHNSMHAQLAGLPAPQSRDRLYVVFWRRGSKRPDLDRAQRPPAWCPRCEQVIESRKAWKQRALDSRIGKYRSQYVYVCGCCGTTVEPGWLPAASAIDWSLPTERIGDRKRPLSEKTMARIRAGLARYQHEFIVPSGGSWNETPHPVTDPHRAFLTRDDRGLLVPVEGRDGKAALTTSKPLRTMTTRNEAGIITMLRGQNAAKLTTEPLDTFAASGFHHGLLMPYYGQSKDARPTSQPIGTLTTTDRYALIPEPQIDPYDCGFRMLDPKESAAGMAFPTTYVWRGTKRERQKLAGNAVCPPNERDLVTVVAESLGAA